VGLLVLIPVLRDGWPTWKALAAMTFRSRQAPLVLAVEDLHWADRSTRNLLAFLARNLRRSGFLC
jgi:predicted ATPase